jgi:hypothetical protein
MKMAEREIVTAIEKIMEMAMIKKLTTNLAVVKIAGKIVGNRAAQMAILCLIINTATFSMSWQEKADQLFDVIAVQESKPQINAIVTKELSVYNPAGKQRFLDYMLEWAVRTNKLNIADVFLAHGANPNIEIADQTVVGMVFKKVILDKAIETRSLALVELLLRCRACPNGVAISSSPLASAASLMNRDDLSEQENKIFYSIAKTIYCYGGRLFYMHTLLSGKEIENFDQAKAEFERNMSLLKLRYSPAVIREYSHWELCEGYNRWTDAFFSDFLRVPGLARLASAYYGLCATNFLEGNGARSLERKGNAAPLVSTAQSGLGSGEQNAEDYDDGGTGDGGA